MRIQILHRFFKTPWTLIDFDDSEWPEGAGPDWAFGNEEVVTDLESEMLKITPSFYIRKTFFVSEEMTLNENPLILKIDYSDGFVAHLNAHSVTRRNIPSLGFTPHYQTASASRETGEYEVIELSPASSLLVPGTNVLCIQVHNLSDGDSDLLIKADLAIAGSPEVSLVQYQENWKYYVGVTEPMPFLPKEPYARLGSGIAWMETDFNDSGWNEHQGSFGPRVYKRIEAEDYNEGGEGVGYHDTTEGNFGAVYRDDDVDITAIYPPCGWGVGWMDDGEWLKYDFYVEETDDYNLVMRMASFGAEGSFFRLLLDGLDIAGLIEVPNTGDWTNYISLIESNVSIEAGDHTLTLYVEEGRFLYVDRFLIYQSTMLDLTETSLYLRKTFRVTEEDLNQQNPLELLVDYMGGFVGYLNGQEVARKNLGGYGGYVYHDQPAYNLHEIGNSSVLTLQAAKDILVAGTNVLAIQLHNTFPDQLRPMALVADLQISGTTPQILVGNDEVWKYQLGDHEPSGGLVDEDGEFSDWIELYNQSDFTGIISRMVIDRR